MSRWHTAHLVTSLVWSLLVQKLIPWDSVSHTSTVLPSQNCSSLICLKWGTNLYPLKGGAALDALCWLCPVLPAQPGHLSAPRGAVLRHIFRGIHAFAGAALAAGMGHGSVLQSTSRQAASCSAWHAVFLNTQVYATTSKPEKFLVRDTLLAVPGVPQGAPATGWEKWWQDQLHKAS